MADPRAGVQLDDVGVLAGWASMRSNIALVSPEIVIDHTVLIVSGYVAHHLLGQLNKSSVPDSKEWQPPSQLPKVLSQKVSHSWLSRRGHMQCLQGQGAPLVSLQYTMVLPLPKGGGGGALKRVRVVHRMLIGTIEDTNEEAVDRLN